MESTGLGLRMNWVRIPVWLSSLDVLVQTSPFLDPVFSLLVFTMKRLNAGSVRVCPQEVTLHSPVLE